MAVPGDDDDLVFTLVVDSKEFQIEMRKSDKVVGKLATSVDAASKSLSGLEKTFSKNVASLKAMAGQATSAAAGVTRLAGNLRGLISTVEAATGKLTKLNLGNALKLDRGMAPELDRIAGRAKSAATELSSLKNASKISIAASTRQELELLTRRSSALRAALSTVQTALRLSMPASARQEINNLVNRVRVLNTVLARTNQLVASASASMTLLGSNNTNALLSNLTAINHQLSMIRSGANLSNNALNRAGRTPARGGAAQPPGAPAGIAGAIDEAFNGSLQKLAQMSMISSGIRNVFLGIRALIYDWQSGIIAANSSLERQTQLLRGLSAQTNVSDISREAAEQVTKLYTLAERVPFKIKELGDSAAKFASIGIQPMAGSIKSLSDAVSYFGGSDELFHRAAVGIQQMGGKGVASMEELRQQIGEAVPVAMNALASAAGISMARLTKLVSTGTVESMSSIALLFDEFNRRYAGASERFMDTWEGMTARATLRWTQFQQDIGKAGYFNATKQALQGVIDALGSVEAKAASAKAGVILTGLVSTAQNAARGISSNINGIVAALKTLGAVYLGARIFAIGAAIRTMVMEARAGAGVFGVVTTAVRNMNVAASVAATGPFMQMGSGLMAAGGAARVAAAGFAMLMTTLAPLLITAGLVAAAFYALGAASDRFKKSAIDAAVAATGFKTALEAMRGDSSGQAWLNADFVEKARQENEALKQEILKRQEVIGRLQSAFSNGSSYSGDGLGWLPTKEHVKTALERLQGDVSRMWGDYNEAQEELLSRPLEVSRKIVIEQSLVVIDQDRAKALEGPEAAYRDAMVKLDRELLEAQKKGSGAEEVESKRQIAVKKQLAEIRHQADIAILEKKQRDFAAAMAQASRESTQWAQAAAGFQHVAKLIGDANADFEQAQINTERGLTLLNNKEPKATPVEKLLDRVMARYDQLKQKVEDSDLPSFIATFTTQLARLEAQGKAAPATAAKIREMLTDVLPKQDKVIDAGALIDRLKNKIEDYKNVLAGQRSEQAVFNTDIDKFRALLEKAAEGYDETTFAAKEAAGSLTEAEAATLGAARALQSLNKFSEEFNALSPRVDRYKFAMNELSALGAKFKTETDEINERLATLGMNDEQKLRRRYETEAAEWKRIQDELGTPQNTDTDEMTARRKEADKRYAEWKVASERDIANASLNIWQRHYNSLGSLSEQMKNASIGWIDSVANSLASMVDGGKVKFGELALSIIKDINAMILKMAIFNAVGGMMGGVAGGFGGSAAPVTSGSSYTGTLGSYNFSAYEKGGIHTRWGSLPLRTYSRGGIANSPQAAVFGEGSLPEAYVPLPDGRSIPVTLMGGQQPASATGINVQVNLINESGTPMKAEPVGTPRFDGRQYILDVVATGIQQPGSFRDTMKASL